MKFTPVDNNGLVEGFCLVKSVDRKTSAKGDEYLDMTLSDSEGEINAKLWRYSPQLHGEFAANEVVKIRGSISPYNGVDQLRIERIRHAIDSDNINISDFVKTAGFSPEDMWNELYSVAEGFKDGQLSLLVTTILKDNKNTLLYWPAAFKLHHAIRSGLLLHTLSILRLAEAVCNIYPFVDRDLLLAGVILHDIAKLGEFEVAESGIATGYSVEGNLLGHLTMGAMAVEKYAEKLGIDRKTAQLVEHMILSHHGEPEFGAAVRPMFIEAELLSELDLLDSRLYEMREATLQAAVNDFSGRVWAMDNRKLFNHGRSDLNKDPDIF